MSQENIEIVRSGMALFEKGPAAFERGLNMLSLDAEWDVSEMPDGKVYRGRAEIRAYWEELFSDAWDLLAMDLERIESADNVVVALVRFRAVGRGSAVPVEVPAAWVVNLREGLVVRAKLTFDRRAALEAAGLRDG